MKKLLLKLISKKIINGKEYLEKPDSGNRQKLYNKLTNELFQENFKHNPKYNLDEIYLIFDKTEELYKEKIMLFLSI